MTDGELLKYIVEGGKYFRENFWNQNDELSKMVDDLSDEELEKLKFGGHDPA